MGDRTLSSRSRTIRKFRKKELAVVRINASFLRRLAGNGMELVSEPGS